jgi:hypothetical protein
MICSGLMGLVWAGPPTKYGHFSYKEAPASDLAEAGRYRDTGRVVRLRIAAAKAFKEMAAAAKQDGIEIIPISGFRSVAYQRDLFARAVKRYGSEKKRPNGWLRQDIRNTPRAWPSIWVTEPVASTTWIRRFPKPPPPNGWPKTPTDLGSNFLFHSTMSRGSTTSPGTGGLWAVTKLRRSFDVRPPRRYNLSTNLSTSEAF